LALTINVDLGGRTPEPITWSKELAKKKLIEYLFVDYLDEQKYGKEYNLIKRFSRIYSPKKVAKNSRALKGFTKSAYKDIFKEALTSIEGEKIEQLIEPLELKKEFEEFTKSEKGKEVIKEEINDLSDKVLARIYEDTEKMKSAELEKDRGLSEDEAEAYFTKIMEVEDKRIKEDLVRKYTIDGIDDFGKNKENIKLKKLKQLGFKDIGLISKKKKESLLGDDGGRLSLEDTKDIYGDSAYRFQKVLFGKDEAFGGEKDATGEELKSVSDALMIKFGYEWEQKNEDKVKQYQELQKPFLKLKKIIDRYRDVLMREVEPMLEGEDEEAKSLQEIYNLYSRGNKKLDADYTITLDGKLQGIPEALGELFLAVFPDEPAGSKVYEEHKNVLKLITMIGRKKRSFVSRDTDKNDYKVDILRVEKDADGKNITVSTLKEQINKIQKEKTQYAKAEIKELEEKTIGYEVKPSRALQKKASKMFDSKKEVFDFFKSQLTDLNAVYFIQLTIKNKQEKGKSKGYSIRSNKDEGKSEMIKKKIVFERSFASSVARVSRENKTDYKEIQKASGLINNLKRGLNLLRNTGSE
tara:strand:- start:1643 stop:3385 length:1743 start_codon:yes stop_codon:yes gene_type:complete